MPNRDISLEVNGDRFEQVLADLLQAEERGERPNISELLRMAPEVESSLREFLRNRADFDKLAPHLAPTATQPPVEAPQLELSPGSRFGSYELLQMVGQGGRGIVYRVNDLELNRPLAVKVLRPELRGELDAVRRFLEEAQVIGQLQHPGIVPVHAIGQLPDGRPYFAMKLVQGRTLAELLDERSAPAHDLPRFLVIFQQVCQAVAYAHSRGVIHRDLKPANVMVGAFAEVQVMDWGLAKVLTVEGASRETPPGEPVALVPAGSDTIRTVRTETTGFSSADGLVVGTIPYMSPEQAKGQVEQVDPRVDVFGLGAILCEILTGLPPYAGGSARKLHLMAAEGDLVDAYARLDGCGAEVELIALAKDCLASERERRPRDAGAVAERVAAYEAEVQERLRRAELEQAAAEARAAEERKRRRVLLGLATAVLALVVVAASGTIVVQHQAAENRADQNRRDAEQRRAVESALAKVSGLRELARWREATAVLEQARLVLGETGPEDLRSRLEVAEAELLLVNRLDSIRQRRAMWVEGQFDNRTAERDYAAAFKKAGLGGVGDDEGTVAARVRASGVAGALVAALDDWALVAREPKTGLWLLGVARRAAPDLWGDRFRDPVAWRDQQALQTLADEILQDGGVKLDQLSPQVLASLGRRLAEPTKSVQLLRAAQRRYPSDFWLNLYLASGLRPTKQMDEALGYYRVAVALRPEVAAAHNDLGNALDENKDLEGAIEEYRTAIALDHKLAYAHFGLGRALSAKGDMERAVASYKEGIDLDPKYANAHYNLGLILKAKDKLDEAISHYEQALRINPEHAPAHTDLGIALKAKGRPDEAVGHYEQALQIDPKYAPAHVNLGAILCDVKSDLDGAIAHFLKAIDLDPKNAHAYHNLGKALRDKHDLDGAIAHFLKAIDLDPKNASAYYGLGQVLKDKGRVEEAISHFEQVLRLDPKLAPAYVDLGKALSDKHDPDSAIACYKKALDLDPKYAPAHVNLGAILCDVKSDLDGAIAHFQKAIDLNPTDATTHYNLGNALAKQHLLDEAVGHFRETLRLDPQHATAHCNLGHALRSRGRFEEALACYKRGHELGATQPNWPYPSDQWVRDAERLLLLDRKLPVVLRGEARPADAAEQVGLAEVCKIKKQYTAAAHFYTDAFAANPKLGDAPTAGHRYNAACYAALAAAGQGADAPKEDGERARLRQQALGWLQADLALWQKRVDHGKAEGRAAGQRTLQHWLADPDLAGVRDKAGLAKLPDTEREAWEKFWADVEALRKRARENK
jgi:tetratricopeptide (TPR) repeat protein